METALAGAPADPGATLNSTGPSDAIDAVLTGRRVLSRQVLGRTTSAVAFGPLDADDLASAADRGIDVEPMPLQDLFVHLTNQEVPA